MRELSLFTGGGGGVWASKLLGHKVVGYVEIGEYQRKIIRQRIDDGYFDNAPIFCDIRKFISEGYAESYKGLVDLISGGFPCQGYSSAGKGLGEKDERNLWPETLRVIHAIRPKFAFLENVPRLRNFAYARRIFGDLAESGYDIRWFVLSASDVGAPHLRERLWILAHTNNGTRCTEQKQQSESWPEQSDGVCQDRKPIMVNAQGQRNGRKPSKLCKENGRQIEQVCGKPVGSSKESANLANANLSGFSEPHEIRKRRPPSLGEFKRRELERVCSKIGQKQWGIEPGMGRVVNGMANRRDRVRAIGNGQVPLVAATAFRILSEGLVAR